MLAEVGDVDAQYLISVGDLLHSAALANLEVQVLTDGGHMAAGVPEGLRIRHLDETDVDLWIFRIGDVLVRLEEVVCCTIPRPRSGRQQALIVSSSTRPAGHATSSTSRGPVL